MLISELAQKTALSTDTIRFYEKKGLLEPRDIKRRKNNYKEYSESAVNRLILIKQAKRLGFTLSEIVQLIHDLEADRLTYEEKKHICQNKIAAIDKKISDLNTIKTHLLEKIKLLQSS